MLPASPPATSSHPSVDPSSTAPHASSVPPSALSQACCTASSAPFCPSHSSTRCPVPVPSLSHGSFACLSVLLAMRRRYDHCAPLPSPPSFLCSLCSLHLLGSSCFSSPPRTRRTSRPTALACLSSLRMSVLTRLSSRPFSRPLPRTRSVCAALACLVQPPPCHVRTSVPAPSRSLHLTHLPLLHPSPPSLCRRPHPRLPHHHLTSRRNPFAAAQARSLSASAFRRAS